MAELPDFDDVEDELEDDAGGSGERTTDSSGSADGFEEDDVDVTWRDGLGFVSVTDGITVGRDSELTAYITAKNRSSVRVGRYYTVPYPDGEQLFTRVSELRYEQQFDSDDANEIQAQRALRSEGVDEADYKFLATLEPLAVLYSEDGDLRRRMTDRVPKPNAVVEEVADEDVAKAGLKIPDEGVFVGHLSVGGERVRCQNASPSTIDYRLRDGSETREPLLYRHVLVAGGTGSGKSHNAKNLLRQLFESTYEITDGDTTVERPPSTVIFDPQNEYSQMHDDNPDVDEDSRRRWEKQGVAYGGVDDVTCWVPDVEGYGYDAGHRAPQREFSVPFTMAESYPWLLAGAELTEHQYLALETLLDDYFDESADPSYRGFSEFVEDPATMDHYVEQTGKVHEATYNALKRKVAGNRVFERVFDRPSDSITDDKVLKQFVEPGGVSVVPTYHVSSGRAEEVVVLAVASLLVDNKLQSGGHTAVKSTPLVVAMDEAHEFLSEADTAQGSRIKAKFAEAAKQGRKERLGLFLITQDPGDVADPVFKQLNTKIALNIGDEAAINSLNLPKELERRVPYLERGEMVVYSPDNSEPVEVKGLSECVVRHG